MTNCFIKDTKTRLQFHYSVHDLEIWPWQQKHIFIRNIISNSILNWKCIFFWLDCANFQIQWNFIIFADIFSIFNYYIDCHFKIWLFANFLFSWDFVFEQHFRVCKWWIHFICPFGTIKRKFDDEFVTIDIDFKYSANIHFL